MLLDAILRRHFAMRITPKVPSLPVAEVFRRILVRIN